MPGFKNGTDRRHPNSSLTNEEEWTDEHHAQDAGDCWSRAHAGVRKATGKFFYFLGLQIAESPIKTLAMCFCFVVLGCLGFVNFSVVTRAEDLWVPTNSISFDHREIVLSYFDDAEAYSVLIVENPEEGGNVLTKEAMDTFWEIHAKIQEVETLEGNTFADLCTKEVDGVTCSQPREGVGRFWGNSFATYSATVDNDEDVLAAVNLEWFPDGAPVSLAALFGNSIALDDGGNITGAKAMVQSYELETSVYDVSESAEVLEWESLMQETMADEAEELDLLNVVYLTSRSIDDGLEESTWGEREIHVLIVTYVIMLAFVMGSLGRCRMGSVERRSWVGAAGVGLVVASGLAAYGICNAFSVPFTTLSQVLPFILVGIGVDNMFVMLAAYDRTNPSLPIEERTSLSLKHSGISVTYTSLTNFGAFMLASRTGLPAVEYLCVYAGTAVLFLFLLQMSAFPALMTLDARRQASGRMDWCCFFISESNRLEGRLERGVYPPATAMPEEFSAEPATKSEEPDTAMSVTTAAMSAEPIAMSAEPATAMTAESAAMSAEPFQRPEGGSPERTPVDASHGTYAASKKKDEGDSGVGNADPEVAPAPPILANGEGVRFSSAEGVRERREITSAMPSGDDNLRTVVPAEKCGSGSGPGTNKNRRVGFEGVDKRDNSTKNWAENVRVSTIDGKGKRLDTMIPRPRDELAAFGRWIRESYAPFILSTKGKVLVLLSAAGLLIAGIYGATKTTRNLFDTLDLAPDDNFARDYFKLAQRYDVEYSKHLPLSVYIGDVDYSNTSVQATIEATNTVMETQEFISGPVDSWLAAFTKWTSDNDLYRNKSGELNGYLVYEDTSTFYQTLTEFLKAGSNDRYFGSVAFDAHGRIEMSRSDMFLANLSSAADIVESMLSARDVMKTSSLDPKPFIFSPAFLSIEQYLVIFDELIANSLLALVIIAALSLLALRRISHVLLVCITVVIAHVELLGFVHYWGLELNAITGIELVIAVGLVVDYMFHIVYCYQRQNPGGPIALRISDALGEIGPTVTLCAVTTSLGVMPMAFAQNAVYRVFFRMFFTIISFGFFQGIVFIPVALSLLPERVCGPSLSSKGAKSSQKVYDDGSGNLATTRGSDRLIYEGQDRCSITPHPERTTGKTSSSKQTRNVVTFGGITTASCGRTERDHSNMGDYFTRRPSRRVQQSEASGDEFHVWQRAGVEEAPSTDSRVLSDSSDCESSLVGGSILTGSSSLRGSSLVGGGSFLGEGPFFGGGTFLGGGSGSLLGGSPLVRRNGMFTFLPELNPRDAAAFTTVLAAPSAKASATAGCDDKNAQSEEEKVPDRPPWEEKVPESSSLDSDDDDDDDDNNDDDADERLWKSGSWQEAGAATLGTPEPHTFVAVSTPTANVRSVVGRPGSWHEFDQEEYGPYPFVAAPRSPQRSHSIGRSSSWSESDLEAPEPRPVLPPLPRPRSLVKAASWHELGPKIWSPPRMEEEEEVGNGQEVQRPPDFSPGSGVGKKMTSVENAAIYARPIVTEEASGPTMWPSPRRAIENESKYGDQVQLWKSSPDRPGRKKTCSIQATTERAGPLEAGAALRPKVWPSLRGAGNGEHESGGQDQITKSATERFGKEPFSVQSAAEAAAASRSKIWPLPRGAGNEEHESRAEIEIRNLLPDSSGKEIYSVQSAAEYAEPLDARAPWRPKIWLSPRGDAQDDLESDAEDPVWTPLPAAGSSGKKIHVQATGGPARDASASKMWSSPMVKDEPESDEEVQMWKSCPGKFGKEMYSAQAAKEFAGPLEVAGEELSVPKMKIWQTLRGKRENNHEPDGGGEMKTKKMWQTLRRKPKNGPEPDGENQIFKSAPAGPVGKKTVSVETRADVTGKIEAGGVSGPKMWRSPREKGKGQPPSGEYLRWKSSPKTLRKNETFSVESTDESVGPRSGEASGPKMWKSSSPVVGTKISVAAMATAF